MTAAVFDVSSPVDETILAAVRFAETRGRQWHSAARLRRGRASGSRRPR
jgi:hypothetical protein